VLVLLTIPRLGWPWCGMLPSKLWLVVEERVVEEQIVSTLLRRRSITIRSGSRRWRRPWRKSDSVNMILGCMEGKMKYKTHRLVSTLKSLLPRVYR